MGQLDGRVAIVTGASRGIGKEIAILFAKEGAKVIVAARTEHEGEHQLPGGIAETVAEAKQAGGEATAVRADISQVGDIEHLVETARKTYGPVTVLVNNAALTYYIPIADMPRNRFQRMLDVDIIAPYLLAQAVIPDMVAAGGGNIVNISSLAARHPEGPPYAMAPRGGTVYGLVKAALERLTTGLAHELFDKNIAVNSLAPAGIVPSPGVMFHKLLETEDDPRAEPVELMARAALILAACTPQEMTGRITYSQPLLRKQGQL
ncbi:MAG: SDR family NAD(P)-dependent oxidoreductase [Chloroflexota bacterium]